MKNIIGKYNKIRRVFDTLDKGVGICTSYRFEERFTGCHLCKQKRACKKLTEKESNEQA